MITLEKIALYKKVVEIIDVPSGKYNSLPTGLSEDDWVLIIKVLGDLQILESNLISESLKNKIISEINKQCENEEVVIELKKMNDIKTESR